MYLGVGVDGGGGGAWGLGQMSLSEISTGRGEQTSIYKALGWRRGQTSVPEISSGWGCKYFGLHFQRGWRGGGGVGRAGKCPLVYFFFISGWGWQMSGGGGGGAGGDK